MTTLIEIILLIVTAITVQTVSRIIYTWWLTMLLKNFVRFCDAKIEDPELKEDAE